ncbi:UvrB/UvrC motif-containing protein [Radiobacillus kanasensis]|uniref:UvrB/UvrC motif-containing protein n=1 Tax=Radiobacillus kanasensis TaxID=2844358 RepID=UPI001E338063|nr:UvrB/UvrC motif-containing protein [Radiobacillus kanasensis]UFT99466.1 UvrB/UvrC motif-containing protein [Radiobacillus kanasensis]
MECQECHERQASLKFTKIVNGNKTEIRVCEQCAKEKGYISFEEEAYTLHDLLSGLFNFDSKTLSEQKKAAYPDPGLTCPKCGMSYQEFARIGKFGCASCYETFSDRLNPILRRVHSGNSEHKGKVPSRIGIDIKHKQQIQTYKEKLRTLIDAEEFEQAAQVRDQIKALEKSKSAGEDES